MERYVEMMKRHATFRDGPWDVPFVAQQWKESGISVEEADEWIRVDCIFPRNAVEARELGLAPKDMGHEVTFAASFGYWFRSGYIHKGNYQQHLKKPEPPRSPVRLGVHVVEEP